MPKGVYTRSAEHKEILRLSMLGKNSGKRHTEQSKQKLREANLGKRHSEETRRKCSEANQGAKSHLWRGGITKENEAARRTVEYKIWRDAVFLRDNFTCVICEKRGIELNADHIKSFAYHRELRYDINNGRTLCVLCHSKTDNYKGKAKCKKNVEILEKVNQDQTLT